MNLVILAISGLCIGAGVLMSEAFGAKRTARLKDVGNDALLFGAALCCAAAALGCALTPWILRALAVPDSIFGITGIYLRITFLGAPFTFFYNALAAGLKKCRRQQNAAEIPGVLRRAQRGAGSHFNWRAGFRHCVQRRDHCRGRGRQRAAGRRLHGTPRAGALPRAGQWRIRRDLLGPILRYGAVTAVQQAVQPICKVLIQRAGQRAGGRGYRGVQRGHAGGRFFLHAGAEHCHGHYDHCPEPRRRADRPHPPRLCGGPAAGAGLLAADGQPDAAAAPGHPVPVCGRGGGRRRHCTGQHVSGLHGGVLRPARADERFPGLFTAAWAR